MSYLKTVKVRSTNGRTNEYLRLVEHAVKNGKPVQRVVKNFGNLQELPELLAKLADYLGEDEFVEMGVSDEALRSLCRAWKKLPLEVRQVIAHVADEASNGFDVATAFKMIQEMQALTYGETATPC